MSKKKELFYDIETTYLMARIWRLGEQVVRHNQLVKGMHYTKIICITYCWNDGKPGKALGWGYDTQDSESLIKKFDKIVSQADVVIGKNSDRFDNKHINTLRMLAEQPGCPTWIKYTDDLEKHIRKNFNLPSNSLDFISNLLGYGGKHKMEFQDWIDIVEKTKNGRQAYKKMLEYGIKDVEDTRAVWNRVRDYIEPKYKIKTDHGHSCIHCGGSNIRLDGTRQQGLTKYQHYKCNDCHTYAGRKVISKNSKHLS